MSDIFLVDDKVTSDIIFVFYCFIFTIVFFGVLFNVVNIIVFIKQGFKDTVNISLFALTLSDLCSLLPLIWLGVLVQPRLLPSDITFVGGEVQFITAGWPHTIFSRLTSWITAFIMFERCLCIALPLKVKTLLTPYTVKCCIVAIYIVVLAGVLPTYFTHSLDWKFYPMLNKTLLGLRLTDNALEVTHVSNFLNNPLSEFSSFVLTASCTVVIVVQLNHKGKWRRKASSSNSYLTGKDRKAIKMVTILSVIFLISVTPSMVAVIGSVIDDNFGIFGRYANWFNISYSVIFMLEALNSSVNIIVYYFMNERFRQTFWTLFPNCKKK